MTLTREFIVQRLDALRLGRRQQLDNVNATNGAIQQCEWLLAEMDKPEPAEVSATNGENRIKALDGAIDAAG